MIGLACVPLVCLGIGVYLVKRRIRIGHDAACDTLNTMDFEVDGPLGDVYSVKALEWLKEEHLRPIQIQIRETTLLVKNLRGRILRKIQFASGIEIMHSTPDPEVEHGPYVLISQKNDHHLVFRLSSERELDKFLRKLRDSDLEDGKMSIESVDNETLFAKASTKDRRQERLDQFFREAYARAFNSPELRDSESTPDSPEADILNETISREELASWMKMKGDNEFVKRMFAMMAKQEEDSISFNEILATLRDFGNSPPQQKLQILFKMCDLDNENRALLKDLADLIKSLGQAAGVSIDDEAQLKLFNEVLQSSGINKRSRYISLEEFNKLFTEICENQPIEHPVRQRNSQPVVDETSSLNSFAVIDRSEDNPPHVNLFNRICAFLETYRQHVFIFTCFIGINIIFFMERFWHYYYMTETRDLRRVMGVGIAITRGAAGALTIDMALILLTVCRNIMTRLRRTVIAQYVPFDYAIAFHKMIAYFIAFFALIHAIGHCVNFYHVGTQSPEGLMCLFQEAFTGSKIVPSISYWFFGTVTGITGLALVIVMCIVYIFALPPFINRAYFAFRFTHLFNIAFYGLTFLHGLPKLLDPPKFGHFVLIPIIIFVIDRIIGLMEFFKNCEIVHSEILPSDVIYIEFRRPHSFRYMSGQWVTVSSPNVSCTFNDAHAFSIASCPNDENMKLYFKAVGPWTWMFRSEILKAQATGSKYPSINLKGPYGDGNQEWKNFEIAVMVGGGIGITPYASTLNGLVQLTKHDDFQKVRCKKVYFLWICRSHKDYEWFVDVLKNVEAQDRKRILETHIFVTQSFSKFDLRTTMLYIFDKHFRATNAGKSMFTGLRAANHFKRPNFRGFFQFIQKEHGEQSKIGVFSCGPNAMNEEISAACSEANRQRNAPSFQHRFETF